MTTDETLIEIVSYNYKASGFTYVFLNYCYFTKKWSIVWRNPINFSNGKQTEATTPNEACKKALEFILSNPNIFSKNNLN